MSTVPVRIAGPTGHRHVLVDGHRLPNVEAVHVSEEVDAVQYVTVILANTEVTFDEQ